MNSFQSQRKCDGVADILKSGERDKELLCIQNETFTLNSLCSYKRQIFNSDLKNKLTMFKHNNPVIYHVEKFCIRISHMIKYCAAAFVLTDAGILQSKSEILQIDYSENGNF
jgi:hypothetical protein